MLLVLQAVMEGGESKKVFVGLEYQKTIRKMVYHVCFLPPIFYKKMLKEDITSCPGYIPKRTCSLEPWVQSDLEKEAKDTFLCAFKYRFYVWLMCFNLKKTAY